MQFDWNEANVQHIARHAVTPHEAEQVIANEPFDIGTILRNGEYRTANLGETDSGRVLVIIATERGDLCRVVTARPANKKERAFYSNQKAANNDQEPEDP